MCENNYRLLGLPGCELQCIEKKIQFINEKTWACWWD